MNKPTLGTIGAVILALWGIPAGADAPRAGGDGRMVIQGEFSTPESVEYYADEDVYLVTNINGSPFAADGNGFISKVGPGGDVEAIRWIDGAEDDVTLNAPKGAAIAGERLFVADIDHVRVFELPSGKQARSIAIEGSTFLNGVTPGGRNCVYVTDSGLKEGFEPSGTDAVYGVCADGQYKAIVKDETLGNPNGVVHDGNRLVVVTFGSGEVLAFKNGKRNTLPAPPEGSLDGVLKPDGALLLISSWDGSAVYALEKDRYRVLAEGLESPADMGFDTKRRRALVPLFQRNEVVVLPVGTAKPRGKVNL